jgi:hypothetical protein
MVNSVTPMPKPPIARETMAGAILGDGVLGIVGDWTTVLMCLLFERDSNDRRGGRVTFGKSWV